MNYLFHWISLCYGIQMPPLIVPIVGVVVAAISFRQMGKLTYSVHLWFVYWVLAALSTATILFSSTMYFAYLIDGARC